MAITGEHINSKLKILLQDDTNIRWTKSEICGWINSAQREILIYKPNANPVFGLITTEIGTKQRLPTGGIQLLDISRNMGPFTGLAAGGLAGKAVTNLPRQVMDRIAGWHQSTVTPEIGVDHYAFDERFPTMFYVWPGFTAKGLLEGAYSSVPEDLIYGSGTTWTGGGDKTASPVFAGTGAIFNDLYETVIIDYCAYRCYSKDAEFTGNAARAMAFYQSFTSALTGKTKAEIGLAPESFLVTNRTQQPIQRTSNKDA